MLEPLKDHSDEELREHLEEHAWSMDEVPLGGGP